jgi:hypothetical protein
MASKKSPVFGRTAAILIKEEHSPMAYDKAERKTVKTKKTAEYGTHEVFAVPSLHSYPLTKNKQPSQERVKAAWDYIHVAQNRAKLGDDAAKATARIRAFAQKHFPDMALEETKKSWATDEVYVFPDALVWPLTEGRQPSVEAVQKSWADIHSIQMEALLSDEGMARAEARVLAFAAQHQIPVTPRRVRKGWFM